LKDTKLFYSDTPTIVDLSIPPCLTFIKARPKFWAKVPDAINEYYTSMLECFPNTKENFDMMGGMCAGAEGDAVNLDPEA
jgi:hypothetical protein